MMPKDRSPLESKKFIAYLIAELGWKVILIVTLLTSKEELQDISGWGWWFMTVTVIVAGFLEVTFIGGQAALDKYVRVAEIVAQGPKRSNSERIEP